MGKKQDMSQLTFFHYVTGITMGSIAANLEGVGNTFLKWFVWNGFMGSVNDHC